MLSAVFGLACAGAGSYALLPTLAAKAKRRLGQRRRTEPGVLYLTFDDGPSAEYTPALLDLLARHRVPATFFVVGSHAQAQPALLRRMQGEGHAIGSHSHRHRSAYLMTPRQTRAELEAGLAALEVLGIAPCGFRPPWGVVNWASLAHLRSRRLPLLLWDVMAQDWRGNCTAASIIRRLRERVYPGAVICLHDGRGAPGAPGRTIQALAVLLPEWLEEGYTFRTLPCYG